MASNVDVVLRLRGQRAFQRQVAAAGTELEAMGVKGSRAMSSFAQKAGALKNFGRTMSRNVTLPIVGIGYFAGKTAVDFDKAMRNVNSIAQLPEKQFAKLEQQVNALAGPTAQAPQTLAEGMYDLVSSGFDAQESLRIVEKAAYAATAGLTDTATSTKAISAVLNAYQLPASAAGKVSDQLFQTVNLGVISFEELASSVGMVLPAATSLGVGLDQVGASISTLTKEGQSGETAITNINQAMTALFKPTEAMKGAIASLGFDNAQDLVGAKGFQGALEALIGTTDGTAESVGKLFANVRAQRAVFGLTGKNAKAAEADLKGMQDTAGATQKALSQQSQSLAYQWQKLKAEAQALAVTVGPTLLGALRLLLAPVKALVGFFAGLPESTQKVAMAMLLLLAAVGPTSSVLGYFAGGVGRLLMVLPKLMAAAESSTVAMEGLGISMVGVDAAGLTASLAALTAAALPIAGIAGAIIAVGVAFYIAYKKVKWFHDAVDTAFGWIKSHWPLLAMIFTGPIIFAAKFIGDRFQQIKGYAADAWGFIKAKGQPVFDWIQGAAGKIGGWFKTAAHAVAGAFSGIFSSVQGPIVTILNFVIDRINNLIDAHNALPFLPDIPHISNIGETIPMPTFSNARRASSGPNAGVPDYGNSPGVRPRSVQGLPSGSPASSRPRSRTQPVHLMLDGRKVGEALLQIGETEAVLA